jgi:thiol-disulfide isomerase/thioredoxin
MKDPLTEAVTTEAKYQRHGDYIARIKTKGAAGTLDGEEYRLYYTLGQDVVLYTSGTLDAAGQATIRNLCGGEDNAIRYRVYVDQCPVGEIHMIDEQKQHEFSFELPPLKHQQFPDMELTELYTGGLLKLSSLRGKPVVVELWGRFCAPCQPAMTHLDEFASTATAQSKRGFQILAVTSDESTSAVQKHVAEKKWSHVQHYLCTGPAYGVLVGREGIPLTLVLDEHGTILWRGNPPSSELDGLLRTIAGN